MILLYSLLTVQQSGHQNCKRLTLKKSFKIIRYKDFLINYAFSFFAGANMLTTLIYRSHFSGDCSLSAIVEMVTAANLKNSKENITGILLFNGKHFFQLLEGPKRPLQQIYQAISEDSRHYNVVKLLDEFSPARRFGRTGMELFDLRNQVDDETVLKQVIAKGTSAYQLNFGDRALQFFRSFIESREKENYFEIKDVEGWQLQPDRMARIPQFSIQQRPIYKFVPIIDPLAQRCDCYEINNQVQNKQLHADEVNKNILALLPPVQELELLNANLSINLVPTVFINNNDTITLLNQWVKQNKLIPEQIILEFNEAAVIAVLPDFIPIVNLLKASGFRIAIDQYGAEYAALSLLSEFQPDRIKISHHLTKNIHQNGPKQAIVQAIVKFCTSLEISVSCLDIEVIEEWMWLESAGINYFQGDLFIDTDRLGNQQICWPERVADI